MLYLRSLESSSMAKRQAITAEQVRHVARLSRLRLSNAEVSLRMWTCFWVGSSFAFGPVWAEKFFGESKSAFEDEKVEK